MLNENNPVGEASEPLVEENKLVMTENYNLLDLHASKLKDDLNLQILNYPGLKKYLQIQLYRSDDTSVPNFQ